LAELLHIPKDEDEARKFRVARQIQEHRLPPVFFLHGAEDVDVGVSQSDEVVGAAIGCGIKVVYERVPGVGNYLVTGVEYNNEALFAFMKENL
jgi:dipeptidyl aminopeptidase/acylaminoacyl peptidase